jgi:hypothetical protein
MNAAAHSEFEQVLLEISALLREAGVKHCVGGSVASSRHGVYRSTAGIDLVADLDEKHARSLCETAAVDAVRRGGSFNLINLATGIKIDCFVVSSDPFRRMQCERSQPDDRGIRYLSPEDSVLTKLRWFRAGGEASDRQWQDLLGVMRAQRGRLDEAHLDAWASRIGVEDLLDRLRAEA